MEKSELNTENALQRHANRVGFRDDWDESDDDFEEDRCDGLDVAFSSWDEVNGMFYTL